MPMHRLPDEAVRPFNLSRWFAAVGLVSIASISALAGWALSQFISREMLQQEAALTQEFVQTLVYTESSLQTYFASGETPDLPALELALAHIASMTDMLRANVYNRERRVLWSSEPELIGRSFGRNDELEQALAGRLVVHPEEHEAHGLSKTEHLELDRRADLFVEIYVPVRAPEDGQVVGVIEFYKNPQPLFHALNRLQTYIALGAAAAGGFLYLALAGLVRRADLQMRAQERRLVDAETLAVMGEMSAAVAHGIRNPLAAIRSSAELIEVADPPVAREAAGDIIAESDRLEAWVRELLSFSRPLDAASQPVELGPVLERCAEEFAREFERRKVELEFAVSDPLPRVRGDALLLGQVLHSLVANALEAMNCEGRLVLSCRPAEDASEVVLAVSDNGPGMTPMQLAQVGKPFFTTKTRGLGVGLSQVRRIVERYGGRVEIRSEPGSGTEVRLFLPAA